MELHLKWMEDCFDPDGDGLYESYINTWPTDAQWYNGGGTAEETSYAYRGHRAALDMALAAHDNVSANHHRMMLQRIKDGFFNRLWLKDVGYSGAYREQGGLQRVHTNPWLYSIFLPIDARLTTSTQNIESLYYPEWALQNDAIHHDGRAVWTSNWTPGIWSVRELWPGDNYHLALSYFQSGLPDDGWEILKGNFMRTGFYQTVPGNLGAQQGGIDFGDCVHPFVRTLVSGLFGYQPDYPNDKVLFAPSFPTDWKQAHIKVSDYSLDFKASANAITYDVSLSKEAHVELQIPIQCEKVLSVLLNGKSVPYQILPMPGRSMLVVQSSGRMQQLLLQIKYQTALPYYKPMRLTLSVKSVQKIVIPQCRILSVQDSQEVLQNIKVKGNQLECQIGDKTGFHTVIAKVKAGTCEQWRILRLKVEDKEEQAREDTLNMKECNMRSFAWAPIDISNDYNADVCKIFQQQYLSPRPHTVSVRIGSNGYSPWAFTFWNSKVPVIALNKVKQYVVDDKLKSPQGVVYSWKANQDKNIMFTSLWDNYPHEATIAMNHQKGKCISFLVCGSTNVMQCDIANAEIVISYDNGTTDTLKLIPPYNYWNLSPIDSQATAPGQASRTYYTSDIDKFCLHGCSPLTIELGSNCRAMVLNRLLKSDTGISKVTLRCLSQEVVVGLMGISVGN